jgi:hypothetical protein
MTDDLLGKIFYQLCERGPLSLRHLLLVSRRFYSVAVNNAHLWTTISFDYSFFHHFHKQEQFLQAGTFVGQCLLRSSILPLCLYIDYPDRVGDQSTLLYSVLNIIGHRGFQRCSSLTLSNFGNKVARSHKIMSFLPESLPSLQHISLSFFDDPIDGSKFPDCPVLERVEMLTHLHPHPPFWGTTFVHVNILTFGNSSSLEDFDLVTISQFLGLHDLTLFTESRRLHLGDVDSKLSIIFKHLQILRIRGHIPSEVLTKLRVPALKELHLEANDKYFTSIVSLQNLFDPRCQYIHALLPKAVPTEEPEWATNLSKLVKKCTLTQSVYISKWMEKACKRFMSGSEVALHVQ